MAVTMTFRTSAALVAAALTLAPQAPAWATRSQPADNEPAADPGDVPEPQGDAAAPPEGDGADPAADPEAGEGEAEAAEGEGEAEAAEGEGVAEAAEGEGEAEAAEGEGEAEAAEGEGEAEAAEGEGEAAEAAEEQPPAPAEAVPPPAPTQTGPVRPDEPTIGGKPTKGTGMMIAGGSLFGLGVAGLITTSLITLNCSFDGPLKCKYRNQAPFLIPMMAAPTLLGAILLGVGVGYRVRYKKWERWTPGSGKKTAVLPFATRDSGGVAIAGRF